MHTTVMNDRKSLRKGFIFSTIVFYEQGSCVYSKHTPRPGNIAAGATAPAIASVTIWTVKGAVQSAIRF